MFQLRHADNKSSGVATGLGFIQSAFGNIGGSLVFARDENPDSDNNEDDKIQANGHLPV